MVASLSLIDPLAFGTRLGLFWMTTLSFSKTSLSLDVFLCSVANMHFRYFFDKQAKTSVSIFPFTSVCPHSLLLQK